MVFFALAFFLPETDALGIVEAPEDRSLVVEEPSEILSAAPIKIYGCRVKFIEAPAFCQAVPGDRIDDAGRNF